MRMRMLDIFSGIGGISLAADWAGIETVAFCEIEPFPKKGAAEKLARRPDFWRYQKAYLQKTDEEIIQTRGDRQQ